MCFSAADVLRRQTGGRLGMLVDRLHDRRQSQLGHVRRYWRRTGERLQGVSGTEKPSGVDFEMGSDGRQIHRNRHHHKVPRIKGLK